MTIRNPIEWAADGSKLASRSIWQPTRDAHAAERPDASAPPIIRRIGPPDLMDALAKGFADFGEKRADVVFLCLFYPIVGWIVARFASGNDMLPLLFPLAAGFALIGPLAGVGLYEISRRREQGMDAGWSAAFSVIRSPALGSILVLGLALLVIFAAWVLAAAGIYAATLGPAPPVSLRAFATDVVTTPAGWTMAVVGMAVGFLFAAAAFAISVVSFPMLLDRGVGAATAVRTSVRAIIANPVTMALWGMIIAGALLAGSLPVFLGLIVVLPVLGHATWHLYRKVVSF